MPIAFNVNNGIDGKLGIVLLGHVGNVFFFALVIH